MSRDPTNLALAFAAREDALAALRREREQEDADVAAVISTAAGERLFCRLIRSKYLQPNDPIVASAARAAPKALANIIVKLAAENDA